jgi:hypothetical protein
MAGSGPAPTGGQPEEQPVQGDASEGPAVRAPRWWVRETVAATAAAAVGAGA